MLDRLIPGTGGSPLRGLANARDSRSKRVSSYDVTGGNADCRQIQPGQTLVLADIPGAGCVNHIWFTIWHEEKLWPRKMVLRIYWDGEESPSVECPVGDFFGTGYRIAAYRSRYTQVTDDGTLHAFWVMPYRQSCSVTVHNLGKQDVDVATTGKSPRGWDWDDRSMYFRASSLCWSRVRALTNASCLLT